MHLLKEIPFEHPEKLHSHGQGNNMTMQNGLVSCAYPGAKVLLIKFMVHGPYSFFPYIAIGLNVCVHSVKTPKFNFSFNDPLHS